MWLARTSTKKTSVVSVRLLMPLAMFLLSLKSIKSVIEEVNNLQCALIVLQERGVHAQLIVHTDRHGLCGSSQKCIGRL